MLIMAYLHYKLSNSIDLLKLPDVSSKVPSNGGIKGFRRTDKNGPTVAIPRWPRSISRAEVRVRSGWLGKGTPSPLRSPWSTVQDSTSMC